MEDCCAQNQCYNCIVDTGPCICVLCTCGKNYVCLDCVHKYSRKEDYKEVKLYCDECKKYANHWYVLSFPKS